jgi:hypothetical protein
MLFGLFKFLPLTTILAASVMSDQDVPLGGRAENICSVDVARCVELLRTLVHIRNEASQSVSTRSIAQSWKGLVQGFIKTADSFTPEENLKGHVLLVEIQGALLALNFAPVGSAASPRPDYVPRLLSNTAKLWQFLDHAHLDRPKNKDIGKLRAHAGVLSKEIRSLASTVALKDLP